jgi:hypothetical protein
MRHVLVPYVVISVLAAFTVRAQAPTDPQANNCPGSAGTMNHCKDNELCCGFNSSTPRCIPSVTTDQCCTHFNAAAVCSSTQSCCGSGSGGVGANTFSFCCEEGSTCCQSASRTGTSTCCLSGTTCCAAALIGVCCKNGEICDADANSCKSIGGTSTAPVVPSTTLAPTAVTATTLAATTTGAPATTTTTVTTPPATTAPGGATTSAGTSSPTASTPRPATAASDASATKTMTVGLSSNSTNASQLKIPPATPPSPPVRQFIVNGSITIMGSFADLLANNTLRQELINALRSDIARLCRVKFTDVLVSSLELGSLIVKFTINSTTLADAAAVLQRVDKLPAQQLSDTSRLYREVVDSSAALLTVVQPTTRSDQDFTMVSVGNPMPTFTAIATPLAAAFTMAVFFVQ